MEVLFALFLLAPVLGALTALLFAYVGNTILWPNRLLFYNLYNRRWGVAWDL